MTDRRRGIYLLYQLVLGFGSILLIPWVISRLIFQPGFREGFPKRLGFVPRLPPSPRRILLHGVSVGEVKALRPLIRLMQTKLPDYELVVSATTQSGLQTARHAFPELKVVSFPLDFHGSTKRFLARIAPTGVVLAELEIWPNFLRQCNRKAIPVAIVNGRITKPSMGGYQRVQKLLPQFDRIRLYCVQNQRYADRFLALGVPQNSVIVTGNLKYDSLPIGQTDAVEPWATYLNGQPSLVLASTHEPEEEQILESLNAREGLESAILIVVPRHPHRAPKLLSMIKRIAPDRPVFLRSKWPDQNSLPSKAIFLVDTFGELEAIYSAVSIAFLGGSFIDHGGQNVLEAAAFALPVLVGPHVDNFRDEVNLLAKAGALKSAKDVVVLLEYARKWLGDPVLAKSAGLAGQEALDLRRGATKSTYEALASAEIF
jgi:3-deoxy-D-manno-octulosonic-acid transferase